MEESKNSTKVERPVSDLPKWKDWEWSFTGGDRLQELYAYNPQH